MPTGDTLRSRLGRLARARHLPPQELISALHAGAVLAVVELTVRWVPLPRLSSALGTPLCLGAASTANAPLGLSSLDERDLRRLQATRRVTGVWPFSDGPCLRQSLVAGHLLRRRSPMLRLGLIDEGDDLLAHAWLEIDGHPLEPAAHLRPFQQPPGSDRP